MTQPTTTINEPDFRDKAEEAAQYRLAGRLEEAEKLYEEIVALGQPMAVGYGNEHLGLVHMRRGEQLREQGKADAAIREFDIAHSFYAKGREGYASGGDPVHVSSTMLNEALLLLKQGRTADAVQGIKGSIASLKEHIDEVDDRGFYDEHLQVKYVRLAGALLDAGDVTEAREAIETAKPIAQRNDYFVMQTEYYEAKVLAAEGEPAEARVLFERALKKVQAFEDEKMIRRIQQEIAALEA
ncbi:MAG TPA: hypothetical protein VIF43_01035 [Patescibacteria group bacterium]|jgi:tetratricopeptide (TPR) repeat protein